MKTETKNTEGNKMLDGMTYAEMVEWREAKEREHGKMKFRSTAEYRKAYYIMQDQYKKEGLKRVKGRRVVKHICLHV